MKTLRAFALVAGVALAALPVLGQSTLGPAPPMQQTAPAAVPAIPADQQATKEQIQKIFEVLRLRRQMDTMMKMMPQLVAQSFQAQMKSINAKLPPGKRITPQDQAEFTRVMNKYMQQALTVYPLEEIIADATPIYQRHISRSDADAVIAFYSSPAGQHMLDELPAIQREFMPVVMARMQTRSRRLMEEMQADLQQVVKTQPAGNGSYIPKSQ